MCRPEKGGVTSRGFNANTAESVKPCNTIEWLDTFITHVISKDSRSRINKKFIFQLLLHGLVTDILPLICTILHQWHVG